MTEVVWEGEETEKAKNGTAEKADGGTTKKVENNTVSSNVNR